MTESVGAPRPWIVMITGEPGSGKTTLGFQLASSLRMPFLSRDQVRGGMLATAGLWANTLNEPPSREAAVDAFAQIVETTARAGVTAAIEFIVTPERRAAFERMRAAANVAVIVTECADARRRARYRDVNDPLLNRTDVLASLGHQSINDYLGAPARELVHTTMQTAFDLPVLGVNTDDGYQPTLDAVVEWVIQQTQR